MSDLPRDPAEPAEWLGVPTALISDCLDRFGVMDAGIRSITGLPLAGWAATIQLMPGDSATTHRALVDARPGSVLVIDAGAYPDRAVWGAVLTATAQTAGVVGAVVDGATRDVAAIRALGFPLFARATSPAGPHKAGGGRTGVVVQCGRVAVTPGDLVVGDEDGVVVVPRPALARLRQAVRERDQTERRWLERIAAGEPSTSVLGLTGHGHDPRHGAARKG
jgi:4-hydroxy-4-methyl-2-oxoglutarate aldolase